MAALFGFILPMVFMIGLMWLLMVRPQQKKQKAHLELISRVAVGDEVETIGGISGKVSEVEEEFVVIFSAKSSFRIRKNAIAKLDKREED